MEDEDEEASRAEVVTFWLAILSIAAVAVAFVKSWQPMTVVFSAAIVVFVISFVVLVSKRARRSCVPTSKAIEQAMQRSMDAVLKWLG